MKLYKHIFCLLSGLFTTTSVQAQSLQPPRGINARPDYSSLDAAYREKLEELITQPELDQDKDGFSDLQEWLAGSNLAVASSNPEKLMQALSLPAASRSTDSDGDGSADIIEYLADTNAWDNASKPGPNPLSFGPVVESLSPHPDTPFTRPLAALVQKLKYDPVKVFNWVYNNIEFQSYEGTRKGALHTFYTKKGNAWDQSSLLIALLRMCGVPARYVSADHGYNQVVVNEFADDPKRETYNIPHDRLVYVQAWLNPSEPQGAMTRGLNPSGRAWIPLVPWHKRYQVLSRGFAVFRPSVVDNLDEIPPELAHVTDEYLAPELTDPDLWIEHRSKSSVEFFEEKLQAYLNKHHPTKSIKDVPLKQHIVPRYLSYLPTSLPATLRPPRKLSARSTYVQSDSALEKGWVSVSVLHRVGSGYDAGSYSEIFRQRFELVNIAGKRLTLDYSSNTANPTVTVRVDGVVVGVAHPQAGREIVIESSMSSRPEQQGSTPRQTETLRPGALAVMVYDALSTSQEMLLRYERELSNPAITKPSDASSQNAEIREGFLGRMGALLATTFRFRKMTTGERADSLLHLNRTYGDYGRLGATTLVTYPEWNSGAELAESTFLAHPGWSTDSRSNVGSATIGDKSIPLQSPFRRYTDDISGFTASLNESQIYEKWLGTPALSTTAVFHQAVEQGIPLLTLINTDDPDTTNLVDGRIRYWDSTGTERFLEHNPSDPHSLRKLVVDTLLADLKRGATIITPTRVVNITDPNGKVLLSAEAWYSHSKKGIAHAFAARDTASVTNGGRGFWDIFDKPHKQHQPARDLFVSRPPKIRNEVSVILNGVPVTASEPRNTVFATTYPVGDPVNVVTGEFYTEERPDIALESIGTTLALTRRYRSRALYNGPFGHGWTWNHSELILPKPDEDTPGLVHIDYRDSQQRSHIIERNPDNTFDYPPGASYRLQELKNQNTGVIAGYVLREKSGFQRRFNADGRLVEKMNHAGHGIKLSYSEDSVTLSDRNIASRWIRIELKNGKAHKATDFTGRFVSYAFGSENDAKGGPENLRIFTDLEKNETRYEYLQNQHNPLNNHNMSKYILPPRKRQAEENKEEPASDWLEIFYYPNDTVSHHRNRRTKDRPSQTFHFQYSWKNRYTETWNESGHYQKIDYDQHHNVIRRTTADGSIEQMGYDAHHNMISFTNANGHTTTYSYDDRRNRIETINPLGHVTQQLFEPKFNRVVYEKDVLGYIKLYRYLEDGNLERVIQALSLPDSFSSEELDTLRNGGHVPLRAESQMTTEFKYDDLGRLTARTRSEGDGPYSASSHRRLSEMRRHYKGTDVCQTWEKNAKGFTTSFFCDAVGRVTRRVDPGQNETTYEYNDYGQIVRMTEPEGKETIFDYDTIPPSDDHATQPNNLIKKTEATGAVTKYQYHPARDVVLGSQLATEIDPLGYRTTFAYDALGRRVESTDRNGNVTRWDYDAAGRVIETVDPEGHITWRDYDAAGNLIRTIDALGNTVDIRYDPLNRETLKRQYVTDLDGNPVDRITETSYGTSNGPFLDTVDHRARPQRHRVVMQTNAEGVVTQTELDFRGQIAQQVVNVGAPDARKTTRSYNGLGRLTRISNGLKHHQVYEYDENGNRTDQYWYDQDKVLQRHVHRDFNNRDLLEAEIDPRQGTYQTTYEYDGLGRLTKTIDALKNETTRSYDPAGNLLSTTNALGQTTKHHYDLQNRRVSTTSASGRKTIFGYDRNGNLIKVTDPDGNETHHAYDRLDRQHATENALGHVELTEYDANGNVRRVILASGETTEFEYNEANENIRIRETEAHTFEKRRTYVTSFVYDKLGRLKATIDPRGHAADEPYFATETEFNDYSQPQTVRDANGDSTQSYYDAAGRLTERIDARNISSRFEHDVFGQRTLEVLALGTEDETVHRYQYDEAGNRTLEIRAEGTPESMTTCLEYDAMSRVTTQIRTADGCKKGTSSLVTHSEYDALGQLTKRIDARGYTEKLDYDEDGRLVAGIDALGFATTQSYNASGNVAEIVYPDGRKAVYQYDGANHLTVTKRPTATEPEREIETREYDESGRVVLIVNPRNTKTHFGYDGFGRLNERTEAMGELEQAQTTFSFDENGNVNRVMTPGGTDLKFHYDRMNRVFQSIDADGSFQEFRYDPNGNEQAQVFQDGVLIGRIYDAHNRLTKVVNSNETTLQEFEYDHHGRVTRATDHNGTRGSHVVTRDYDSFGRLTRSVQDGVVVTAHYNPSGGLVRLDYPADDGGSGRLLHMTRDARNQAESVSDQHGLIAWNQHDAQARLSSRSLGNGVVLGIEYDPQGRESLRNYSGHGAIETSYDENGNVLTEHRSGPWTPEPTSFVYSYDARDRMILQHRGDKEETDVFWEHNVMGSWVRTNQNNVAGKAMQPKPHKDNEYRGAGLAHNPRGNLEQLLGHTLHYDWAHRIKFIDSPIEGETTQSRGTFTYDAFGRRVTKTINDVTTRYIYWGDQVIEERKSAPASAPEVRSYVFADGLDQPLMMETSGRRYYYLRDRTGSILALSDEAGELVETYNYGAFGHISVFDPQTGETRRATAFGNPYGFTGRRLDTDHGLALWYFRSRVYSDHIGRFLQRDPVGYRDGPNLYTYAHNNPRTFVDPLGTTSRSPSQGAEPSTFSNIVEVGKDLSTAKKLGTKVKDFADTFAPEEAVFLNTEALASEGKVVSLGKEGTKKFWVSGGGQVFRVRPNGEVGSRLKRQHGKLANEARKKWSMPGAVTRGLTKIAVPLQMIEGVNNTITIGKTGLEAERLRRDRNEALSTIQQNFSPKETPFMEQNFLSELGREFNPLDVLTYDGDIPGDGLSTFLPAPTEQELEAARAARACAETGTNCD